MTSRTSRIRNSLNSLWQTVLEESMSGNIEVNNAVSHAFLERHRIRLVSHDFENPEIQGYNPPVLFAPSPQSFLDVHPIQPEKCDDPRLGNPFYQFLDYEPGGKWMQPTECAHGLFRYMEKWAYTGFPRRDTDFIDSLQSKKGITPISVPHGIVSGKGFAMRTRDSRWGGNIYEYDIDFWGVQHPHVN